MDEEQKTNEPLINGIKDRLSGGDKTSAVITADGEDISLPATFKVGRQGFFRLQSVERDLFSEQRERESGAYIISGIDRDKLSKKNLTETDLMAFNIAICKALYNQSLVSGNEETNSGLSRTKAEKATKAQRAEAAYKAQTERDPKKREALEAAAITAVAYKGDVIVALHNLCKDGYGDTKATTIHKKSMETLIKFLDSTPVTIHYANGDVGGTYLCKITEFYKREKDGAVFYSLHLNPTYTENVYNNFGKLPQNAMQLLAANTKKMNPQEMKLYLLLSIQTKERPFIRTIGELLEDIGIELETYKKRKDRIEENIMGYCATMQNTGIISSYEPTYTTSSRGRRQLSKLTFLLNPDFGK